ncbi:MAG: hypothetical protein R3D65_11260 [Zhengella sp.]|uniref:hypothetical protein n=1 Tax=Zhengella sp. TaxID=2282762 RepID=UPI003526EBB8
MAVDIEMSQPVNNHAGSGPYPMVVGTDAFIRLRVTANRVKNESRSGDIRRQYS